MNPPDKPDLFRKPPSYTFDPVADSANEEFLAGLNDSQREAVTHPGGPMLVLAGAGSGKTRVITHRIAHLIRVRGVMPQRIVAVTFTNKAAGEMRDRVARLLNHRDEGAWIGTFHSLCLRILRRDGHHIGLDRNFVIYDTDDQLSLVKRILKDESRDDAERPRSYLSKISRAKNGLVSPDALEKQSWSPDAKFAATVYRRYEQALTQANAVDFDDLLVKTLELFRPEHGVDRIYSDRCEHLLVDEYQDTNRPQYLLIRKLCEVHRNVCAVGDEDQSIYRFRGAEIRNILDYERDFEETTTIRLEQNYRSTGNIISAAGAVIAHNLHRKGKTLWTDNEAGAKLRLFRAPDDRVEATWVAQQVRKAAADRPFEDIAILYRTNAQSRQIEEVFRRDRIPYQIVGSVQFYARKEIKDLLSYLMLSANPADDVAFLRAVNTPPRGIGNTSIQSLQHVARTLNLPMADAAHHALEQDVLSKRPAKQIAGFLDFVDEVRRQSAEQGVAGTLDFLIDKLDYGAFLEKSYPGQGSDRMENVRGLVSAAVEYAEESDEDTLQGFLDHSALVAGADEIGKRPGVTLMTIHCAKGLEFPYVFLIGLEENLFPHSMASGSDEDIEEERRLCYVAMTRAEKQLFLTHARFRRFQGALMPNPPSRFLDELPEEFVIEESVAGGGDGGFFDPTWGVRDGHRGGSGRSFGSRGSAVGSSAAAAARRAAERKSPRTAPAPAAGSGETPPDGFGIGARVRHPRFGAGKILDREGKDKHLKLTIHFSEHGPKKILPAYTRLEVEV